MSGTFRFKVRKIFIAFFALITLSMAAYADDNMITAVILSKPKDLNGAYQLTVKADKPVDYKSKVDSNDSIYFDLKNSVTIDNLDTVYDNVSNVDGVIVQQLENNKVRIYVNGQNTSSTQLAFKTVQTTGSNVSNQVVINRPIREYRPTTDIKAVAAEDIDWDNNSFNAEHLADSFIGMFGAKNDMTVVVCVILLVMCVVISRKIFSKIRLQEEPLIGLNSYQKASIDEELSVAQIPTPVSNVSSTPVREAQRFTTNTIRKPSQAPVSRAPQRNLVKENYARGAYEQSQRNPYRSAQLQEASPVQYQKRVQKPHYTSSSVQRREVPKSPAPKTGGASVDNLKFLESVTKIYEQSGRRDLAQGLRVSINKKKSAV